MRKLVYVMAILGVITGIANAADSPQFRGIRRDGKFPETGLLKAWPDGGPPVAWVAKGIGEGYSSVSVVGDTIYATGMESTQGSLVLLDLDGNIKGKYAYGEETQDNQAPGPRSAPTINDKRLYILSGLGEITCFKLPTCAIAWQVNILERFEGVQIGWTLAESLLVDGANLICTPGGPDASVVALDKMTGETVWRSEGLSEPSAYCSPDVFDVGGRRIIVTMTAKSVVGLDAASGKVLWTHPHETDYDIHAVTPVFADGMLYYTAGYGSGGGMLEVSADGSAVKPKWTDKKLDCQHHGVVLVDGYIYGTGHKNRDLVCLELKTGKVMWEASDISQGVTVYADGMLYIYEGPQKGIVSLVKAQPDGFERTGSFEVTEGEGKHWTHPTIAGGRLYIRHGDALTAYDVTR